MTTTNNKITVTRKHIERPFEVKSTREIKNDAGNFGVFEGHASLFGELDSYLDVVMPGAFGNSLKKRYEDKGRKVPMLWQHDTWNPIGIYPEVKEDDIGLFVTGHCNLDVQQGRECFSLMKQGALTGLSIGYRTIKDEWDTDNGMIRYLYEVDLREISPVTFPALDSARVESVKSMIEGFTTLSDCERALRDAGYTKSEASAFIAQMKTIITRGDPVADGGLMQKLQGTLNNIRNL